MIAMAMACGPRLLIADEPTTALDVMVQAQILELLKTLVSRANLGVVFISHDLSVLSSSCDRIAVMYAGRIVEEGPAASVFDDSLHPYSRALAGAFPRIGDQQFRYAPAGLPGDPPFPSDIPLGLLVPPALPDGDRPLQRRGAAARPVHPGRRWRPAAQRLVSCHRPGEVRADDVVVA